MRRRHRPFDPVVARRRTLAIQWTVLILLACVAVVLVVKALQT